MIYNNNNDINNNNNNIIIICSRKRDKVYVVSIALQFCLYKTLKAIEKLNIEINEAVLNVYGYIYIYNETFEIIHFCQVYRRIAQRAKTFFNLGIL